MSEFANSVCYQMVRLIISILHTLYVYNRNFAPFYSGLESIDVVRTDRKSILIIRVKVNSKSELVEDRVRNFALYVIVSRPLSRDVGVAKDYGSSEAGQLPRVWTRGRSETKSRQRVSGAKSP